MRSANSWRMFQNTLAAFFDALMTEALPLQRSDTRSLVSGKKAVMTDWSLSTVAFRGVQLNAGGRGYRGTREGDYGGESLSPSQPYAVICCQPSGCVAGVSERAKCQLTGMVSHSCCRAACLASPGWWRRRSKSPNVLEPRLGGQARAWCASSSPRRGFIHRGAE